MTTYYPQNEREERIVETMRSEPDVDFTAGLPMPETGSDAEVIVAIRAELWKALCGRDLGGDRSLIGMVKRLRTELDEARNNRRGEFELRMMTEAALRQARREYGAFGTLSGETLAMMDAAVSPSVGEATSEGSVSLDPERRSRDTSDVQGTTAAAPSRLRDCTCVGGRNLDCPKHGDPDPDYGF